MISVETIKMAGLFLTSILHIRKISRSTKYQADGLNPLAKVLITLFHFCGKEFWFSFLHSLWFIFISSFGSGEEQLLAAVVKNGFPMVFVCLWASVPKLCLLVISCDVYILLLKKGA